MLGDRAAARLLPRTSRKPQIDLGAPPGQGESGSTTCRAAAEDCKPSYSPSSSIASTTTVTLSMPPRAFESLTRRRQIS